MLHTGARATNRVRNLRRFSYSQHGQSVPELVVTPASLSAQPLWPVPAVPAPTAAVLGHRYSRAHRHRCCPSRRLQPPRRASRPRASAWLKGAEWRAAGETWAPQAKLWRKCTVAGLYFQRFGRHICPFVKRRSSEHFLFTQNRKVRFVNPSPADCYRTLGLVNFALSEHNLQHVQEHLERR